MDKIKKEVFLKWVEQNNWLLLNESPAPTGHKATYLTPSGDIIIAMYNLNSELENIGKMVAIPQPMPGATGRFPLDFRGGTNMPQL